MEQRNVIKNVASTAFAVGLTISIASSGTNTTLINGSEYSWENYKEYEGVCNFQANSAIKERIDNIYVQNITRNIDKVSGELFGNMRDATEEERESVERYVKSISKSTGVNFFDIC